MELKIEYVDIDTLKPYENNARSHGKDDVKAIVESINAFGFNDPIGVWHDEIVEGHGRLMAAREIGMTKVPIIRLDELTDEQRRAYMLAHNKTAELSGWNFDLLDTELADISEFDMSKFGFDTDALDTPAEIIEDDYDFKETVEHRANEGDLFQLGNHRLMCGDSSSADDVEKLSGGGTSKNGVHRSSVWCRNRLKESDAQCRPEGRTANREHNRGHAIDRGIVRDAQGGIYQSTGTLRGGLLVLCNIPTGR